MDSLWERIEALEQQMQRIGACTRTVERLLRLRSSCRVAALAALGLTLGGPVPVWAKTFHCGNGDVPCLIDAINEANANGKKNTIRLESGTYSNHRRQCCLPV